VEILPARFTENSDTENSVTDNSSENSSAAEAQANLLIDRFGGYADLLAQQLRPIRANSFAEDPRRIFRAVRFAHRFNLAIAPTAVAEIIQVMASGLHDGIGGSRLRAEVQYILTPEFLPGIAAKMLRSLSDLGALRCIHRQFLLSSEFDLQLSQLHDWWQNLGADWQGISISQLSLELLLSALSPQFLAEIELGLTPTQTKRLAQVGLISIALDNLSQPYLEPAKPSQICQILEKFDELALLIWGAKEGDRHRQDWLWQYLSQWRKVKPMLTGNDLKKLGCPPGKAIGEVLWLLRAATLDGEIYSLEETQNLARQLISEHLGQG
jgi:tRNA nucleotidyltransferase (CCA-adding enzyme)